MFSDGSSFVKRVNLFREELEKGSYPNATSLSKRASCSRSTAQRVIDRLRDEYLIPIKYDSSRKGYYLAEAKFEFDVLPPGKDELTALLMMRDLASSLGDPELKEGISALWGQYRTSNRKAVAELEEMVKHFSSDSTEVAVLADSGALSYLEMAARGESVEIRYKSPWRHEKAKVYCGHVEHVHLENHNLYILFRDERGNERILNTAFVLEAKLLDYDIPFSVAEEGAYEATHWLEGYGIWAGGDLHEVEISILPPASRYYARQRWDATQEDSWEGEVLVRKMHSIISPELVRRILGLGRFVKEVKPESLKTHVLADANILVSLLGEGG